MKKFKVIPAAVFILLVASYLAIFSSYSDTKVYNELSPSDLTGYSKLEENDQIKIIGLPQDSVQVKPDFSKEGKEILGNVSNETYTAFQTISSQMAGVSEKIYFVKRLILLGFLLTTIMVAFKKKFKYNVTFQKALYENVKVSLMFVLFSITALLITQTVLGTLRSTGQMAQIFLGEAVSTLKYALLYSVFISIFIYFHPQNIHWYNKRLERKRKNEQKAK